MSEFAIRVEGLSKQYRIGEKQASYKTLRDLLAAQFNFDFKRSLFGRQNGSGRGHSNGNNSFWALKDVSFEVKQGEVLGMIGRNGAGKSTLLKILARITEPTRGYADIVGRVGSLLEIGTGFHPELTGRENIYLSGAILGMKRKELARKFDEIVAFAEVEQFVDTPVKQNSSGMYLRLAIAVAAHLETEILLVDEVLAVGDTQFQKKCLGKMKDVSRDEGRTVLFVSHNMAAVSNLCTSAILLQSGHIASYGASSSVINYYLESGLRQVDKAKDVASFRPSWASSWITSARILDPKGQEQGNFGLQSDVVIEITFESPHSSALKSPVMGIVINHMTMGIVAGVNTRMTGFDSCGGPFDSGAIRCTLKQLPFLQGTYTVDVWLGDGPEDLDCLVGYLRFTIEESDIYGTGRIPFQHMGIAFLKPEWQLVTQDEIGR
jgi:lipopolysaccharide transport system ATP-binding protein